MIRILLFLFMGTLSSPVWAGAVNIGCLYPMSGRAALYGQDSIAAVEMAAGEINVKGGAAGRQLRVLFADDQSKPAFAARIARRYLEQDKVDFLRGGVSSGVGLAVSEVAAAQKKIFIGTDHASSRLVIENFHRYYFRVSNCVYQSMAAGAFYLADLKDDIPLGLTLSARHHNNWPDTEMNRRFVQNFFQKTGRYPSYSAHGAYAAMYFIAAAVEKAGGPTTPRR